MNFSINQIYHIFNQGNNRGKIFFNDRNYYFFIKKIKEFIGPYGQIICCCLMPNHFHILLYVDKTIITLENSKKRTLNRSIGIMLMSYTFAINKQEHRSGSLFRPHTKITDGWTNDFNVAYGLNKNDIFNGQNDRSRICFEYIHNNPIKAKMVINQTDWEFSSAREYVG